MRGICPAMVFTSNMIARGTQFQAVGPISGTPNLYGLCLPDPIMVVFFPDQCVGDFMEDGVANIGFRAVAGQVE